MSCCEGDVGHVYPGKLPFEILKTDLKSLERPSQMMVMMNVGNPELAFKNSFLPNDGVGLARLEFIINEYVGIHPMALLHPDRVGSAEERAALLDVTKHYKQPADFFVQRLSEGVGTIGAAFHPKPVIVRLSDFKTYERYEED